MNPKQPIERNLRKLRVNQIFPIQKVESKLVIDPSILGKIERDERNANREIQSILAKMFATKEKTRRLIFSLESVAYQTIREENTYEIIKMAKKNNRLKNKNLNKESVYLK